jgi:flagellar basal body-associated protein FliL
LIVLIVIVVGLVVAILLVMNLNGKSDAPGTEAATTATEEGQGLVVQDEVTVDVDIPDAAPAGASGSEEPAEE